MKLTTILLKQRLVPQWKGVWKTRGRYVKTELRVPPSLVERGVPIVDPNETEPIKKWVPPVDDPRYFTPIANTEKNDYKEIPAFMVTTKTRLVKGVEHACILTKSKQVEGFPGLVERLIRTVEIPDQDKLVQRCIMQSQIWDPTMEKLPKRIDKNYVGWNFVREHGIPKKRTVTILMRNLIRLCQSLGGRFPSITTDRRLNFKPFIKTNYEYDGENILIQGLYEYLLSGRQGLSAFATEEEVDATTTYTLPNIYPISPLIDLAVEHNYELGDISAFNHPHSHSVPQTLFFLNTNSWNNEQRQARALLYCSAVAMAQARAEFGHDVRTLPKPVSVQCINLDPTHINFTFFQLNTLDFTSKTGVKNIAWFDSNNRLFLKKLSQPWLGEEFEKHQYLNYDPKVFEKFLAVMLTGVPEAQIDDSPILQSAAL